MEDNGTGQDVICKLALKCQDVTHSFSPASFTASPVIIFRTYSQSNLTHDLSHLCHRLFTISQIPSGNEYRLSAFPLEAYIAIEWIRIGTR